MPCFIQTAGMRAKALRTAICCIAAPIMIGAIGVSAQVPIASANIRQTTGPLPGDPLSPTVGRSAPNFTLPDATGKKRTLTEFKGRPLVVFFFCGCPACSEVADRWAMQQKALSRLSAPIAAPKAVKTGKPATQTVPLPLLTIIVYSGDATAASDLAERAGLDKKQTLLLSDVEQDVTLLQYKVDPCPRAFVLSSDGILRYTNNHVDDAPQKAPGAIIADRTLEALHKALPQPVVSNAAGKTHP